MAEEGFLRRWARRKSESREGEVAAEPEVPSPEVPALAAARDAAALSTPLPASAPASVQEPAPAQPAAPAEPAALPTMDDVAALDGGSDFSAFVARGVDQAVRRSALKKLFSDPHFNVMDKLDVYIDDYTQASPVPEAMLAKLTHAKSVFQRLADDAGDGDGMATNEARNVATGPAQAAAAGAEPAPSAQPSVPSAAPAADATAPPTPQQETQ